MEKIKNFVVKYQLVFKLCIIVLLIVGFFIPFFCMASLPEDDYSLTSLTASEIEREYLSLQTYTVPFFVFCSLISVFLIVHVFVKKAIFIYITCGLYIIAFALLLADFFQWMYILHETIPHISFWLYFLLFVFNAFAVVFLIKDFRKIYPKKLNKTDRIAELEKKVAELENKTADPEQRELHPKDKDGE